MADAGSAPDRRWLSTPRCSRTKVGMLRMPKRWLKRGLSSLLTLTNKAWPFSCTVACLNAGTMD